MPDDNTYGLSRRKALLGLSTIGAAGVGAGIGTSALFSDEETFNNNTITAGTTNLIVEAVVEDLSQGLADSPGDVIIEATDDDNDGDDEVDGDPEIGITATDIKPGDSFLVGFNVIVEDNPMYVAAQANDVSNSAGDTPEPEPTPDNGELGANIDTVLGYDGAADGTDANNFTWDQTNSPEAPNNPEAGTSGGVTLDSFLSDLENNGFLYRDPDTGADPTNNGQGHGTASPTELGNGDNVTHWQYFEVPIGVGNEIQGDSISWDVKWYAEQVRNNPAPSGPSDVVDGSVN